MAQSIDVFTNSALFESGEKWSCGANDVATNFPECKFLLHEDDVNDADLTWTDRVNGVVIADSIGFGKDSIGVRSSNPSNNSVSSGTLPAFGTEQFVLIWQGSMNANGNTARLGNTDTAGPGIAINGGDTDYIIIGANYANSDVLTVEPTYPFTGCMSLHADLPANEARKWAAGTDGTYASSSVKNGVGSSGDIGTTWTALASEVSFNAHANSGIKLLALFAFTTAPADTEIEVANKWMAANPGKLYPGWAGRT